MSDEEKLTEYYAKKYGLKSDDNPNGITEDDIKEHIDNLKGIEKKKEVIEAERFLKELQENRAKELLQKQEEEYNKQMKQLEEQRRKETDELFNNLEDDVDVFGIKVSKADMQDFRKDFEVLVTPDEKTGDAPILEMLRSNDILLKVAYLLKNQDIAKKALTQVKTQTKKEIEEKLDMTPREQSGQAPQGQEFSVDDWGRPEKI
jgi:hypothetical protein